jgi:hypothetical protein
MDLRNKKQAATAEKEIKRSGQAAMCNGAVPGAVVTLKVDHTGLIHMHRV